MCIMSVCLGAQSQNTEFKWIAALYVGIFLQYFRKWKTLYESSKQRNWGSNLWEETKVGHAPVTVNFKWTLQTTNVMFVWTVWTFEWTLFYCMRCEFYTRQWSQTSMKLPGFIHTEAASMMHLHFVGRWQTMTMTPPNFLSPLQSAITK